MKFEFKGKRIGKGLALVGTLALCLTLSGCYIPPDEIQAGTENMTVGSNNLPFDPIPTNTAAPTQPPTQAPTDPPAQPTINWDNWGTTNAPTNTQSGNTGSQPGPGTILVVTQAPTDVPVRTSAPTQGTTSSVLKKGATGDDVRAVQKRLKELDYLSGSTDGDFGSATEAAVRAFQQVNGLTADGVVGAKTLEKLNSASAKKNPGTSVNNNNGGNTIDVVTKRPTTRPTAKPTARPTSTPKVEDVYLEMGSSGTKVRTMQQRLISLGWLAGSADGEYGGATQAAVKAFQERMGLWADGVAGPNTLEKLYSSSARSTTTPVATVGGSLKEGMNGDGVRALQRRLKTLGFYDGSIDGDYGTGTKNAVIAFQRTYGLTADGVAGTSTLDKLYAEDLKKESEVEQATKPSSTGYVTLEQGDDSDQVRKLQEALKKMGYYSGSVDGSYGSGTVNAVMAFQRMNDLTVDGVAGPATQRVLYGTGSSISYATLREGATGSAVRNLQYTLYELGYYDGKVDGDYGDTTKDAVRAFQIQNDLTPVDGIAGNKTQQKLYSSSAKSATSANTSFETLREGAKGSKVIELQEALVNLGYMSQVTGEYDAATKAAVKLFQQVNNISPVDGLAGAVTQQKLYSDNAKGYGN